MNQINAVFEAAERQNQAKHALLMMAHHFSALLRLLNILNNRSRSGREELKGDVGVDHVERAPLEGRREFGRRKWPTEPQTQITSESKQTKCESIHTRRGKREGPVNNSNAPEEVLVWEEMDALT